MGKVNPRFIDPLLDVILGILPWATTCPKPSRWRWLELISLSAYLGGNDEEKFTPFLLPFSSHCWAKARWLRLFELSPHPWRWKKIRWTAGGERAAFTSVLTSQGGGNSPLLAVFYSWGDTFIGNAWVAIPSGVMPGSWPRHPWWEGTLPSTSLLRLGPACELHHVTNNQRTFYLGWPVGPDSDGDGDAWGNPGYEKLFDDLWDLIERYLLFADVQEIF